MAVWEPANGLRKAFNWFAPIVSLALATIYIIIIQPLIYEPPKVLGIFPDILAEVVPKALKIMDIIDICVVTAGVVIYYIVCFGPIKNDELNIWPVDIMVIITMGLTTWVGHWTGFLMFLQWVFVWFLGDDPIWELAKK
ncbi:MAG: hypothetical protein ACTSO9_15415 [Candidatus Helarchaeota archaeon]